MIGVLLFVLAIVALLAVPAVLLRRRSRRAAEQARLNRSVQRARGELR